MNMEQLLNQLRQNNAIREAETSNQRQQGIPAGGGTITPGTQFQNMDMYQSNNQQQPNTTANVLDALKTYNNASGNSFGKNLFGGAGSSLGATGSAYAGSGLGGTGFGLGGSLVSGGASGAGAGAGLGGMLGGGAASGGFGALGSTTAGGLGGMLGGGAAGGAGAAGGGFGALGSTTAGGLGGLLGGGAAGGGAAAGGAGAAGGGLMTAAMSNPWTAIAAAIIGGANYFHNKDISSWNDSLKGKGGGNLLDYYGGGGGGDGKTHGFIGKFFDQDAAVGQSTKAVTDFNELDFSNAWKNAGKAVKSIFSLKFL